MTDSTLIHVDLSPQEIQSDSAITIQPNSVTADYSSISTGVSYTCAHNVSRTHRCLICDSLGNPDADVIDVGVAWICPTCKSALKQVVDIVNS